MTPEKQKILSFLPYLLIGFTTLGLFATDIYAPCFIAMARDFQTTIPAIEWSLNFNFVGLTFGVLLYGPLADHFGRRPIFLLGLSVFVLGSFLVLLSQNITFLWIARFFQGFGSACGTPLTFAVFRELFSEKKYVQWLSVQGMILSSAPALAPILGAYIHTAFHWQYNFVLIFALSLCLLGIAFLKYEETLKKPSPLTIKSFFQTYQTLLSNRSFILYASMSGFTLGGLFSLIVASPYVYLEIINVTEETFSMLLALGVVAFTLGNIFNRKLIAAYSSLTLLRLGIIIECIGGILMLYETYTPGVSLWSIRGFSLLHTFGMAFVFPNANVLAMNIFPTIRGASGSLYNFIQFSLTFLFMSLTALSHDETTWSLCFYSFLGSFLALLCFFLRKKP